MVLRTEEELVIEGAELTQEEEEEEEGSSTPGGLQGEIIHKVINDRRPSSEQAARSRSQTPPRLDSITSKKLLDHFDCSGNNPPEKKV